jgi:hypothetical protein
LETDEQRVNRNFLHFPFTGMSSYFEEVRV